jgi:GT2 family glycosyltransferase
MNRQAVSKVAVSIVLHNTDEKEIHNIINECANSTVLIDIYIVDNSPNNKLSYLQSDERINYFKANYNGGFGCGHNTAIKKFKLLDKYDYCLVMNSDIMFELDVVEKIIDYMDKESTVGVLMPKVLNSDGTLQFARRLLPSPLDIIRKKFLPSFLHSKRYEMIDYEPNNPVEIVGLCGCFMFLRTEALKVSGTFDERYFMYFEDLDLCRRIAVQFSLIYHPNISIIHSSNNEHRRSFALFYYALRATILYFNKWGYFDKERLTLNEKVYSNITQRTNA